MVLAKNFTLTGPQRNLLERGLTFIPTIDIGKNQKQQLQLDLQNYHRRIKLAVYFKNAKNRVHLPFVGSSSWSPPMDELPVEIKNLIKKDLETLKNNYRTFQEKHNLSIQEIKALRELQKNKNVIIKPADKGSAVVILSRTQYTFEVERQLKDKEYYQKLDEPIHMNTIPMVDKILDQLKAKKFINAKQKAYLKGDRHPRERRFYILPKIHKDPEKWTIPFELPPGRPIVSDCGSETYFTAEFLDYYLNPLSCKHPSYVKDTYHFVEIIKKLKVPPNSFFFSMDVDSLYTNIEIEAGIKAIKRIFERYPDPRRPNEELIQLLDINLKRNDFVFNGEFYLQIKGTAMGKRFAPAYANIFMAFWEEDVFGKCPKKPFCYLRYLDDIWGVWEGSQEEFDGFVRILNSHDPSIRLKVETNYNSIDFLDTTVYKDSKFSDNHQLDIKIFFKKTDTHALLHKSSFHPRHTFAGLVKSQLLRFRRVCTRDEDFLDAVHILFKALRGRGYSQSFLRKCLKNFQRRESKDRGKIIPLITKFSSTARRLNYAWKGNFNQFIVGSELIPGSQVISAYRRNPNLRDLLIRAKLPSWTIEDHGFMTKHFTKLEFVRNAKDGTIFRIRQSFSPKSKNCVYILFCSKCGKKYVGETKNSLCMRMVQHRYNIRNHKKVDTPLVDHFITHGMDSVRIAGLQSNGDWTDWERKKKERYWIYMIGTREPVGLNIKKN